MVNQNQYRKWNFMDIYFVSYINNVCFIKIRMVNSNKNQNQDQNNDDDDRVLLICDDQCDQGSLLTVGSNVWIK